MVIKFPFRRVPDAEFSRPFVECYLSSGMYRVFAFALVDSGADVSFVPSWVAEALHLPIKERITSVGFAGISVDVGVSAVELELGNHRERYKFTIPVHVLPPDTGVEDVVLGRAGLFSEFDITFKEAKGVVVFKRVPQKS